MLAPDWSNYSTESNKIDMFPGKNRETIGLAGQYSVAAELCKRGFYAQLTLGNHKKTDILVEQEDKKLFRVSVKTKTSPTWRSITGIWADGDLLVFVDLHKKQLDERPNFYIVNVEQWKAMMNRIRKTKDEYCKIDKPTNTLYWEPWNGNKGWRGCTITINDISEFSEAWPTL